MNEPPKDIIRADIEEKIQHFLNDTSSSPGLRRVNDEWSYSYNVEETRMNTDPFVNKAMKQWDTNNYEAIRGFTKRARLDAALEALSRYKYPQRYRRGFDPLFNKAYKDAVTEARYTFIPETKLYRLSTPNVCDTMNLNSSAGFSFPGLRKSECVQEAFDVARYIQHMCTYGKKYYVPPCKLALRGHLTSIDELKTRPVWIYPFELTILEGKWAIPFYEHLEQNVKTVHFGPNSMQRLAEILNKDLNTIDRFSEVTLDWSAFDSSVPNFLIEEAFEIIWDSFDNAVTEHNGSQIDGGVRLAQKNRRLFDMLKHVFINTKIMLPNGVTLRKTHGIPSGSYFTQCVGSIVNYIVVQTINKYFELYCKRILVLGDDSSFLVNEGHIGNLSIPKVSEFAWKYFGLTLKHEKVRIARVQTERKFLGYQVNGLRFVRDDDDWLKMALYPEHDIETLETSASRVFAYYLLGGCNSFRYCSFYHYYFRVYYHYLKDVAYLPLTKGLKRMFKYVLRINVSGFKLSLIYRATPFNTPYVLSLGDKL